MILGQIAVTGPTFHARSGSMLYAARSLGVAAIVCASAAIGASASAADYPTAAVAADHALASKAGVEILKAGGNAIDAAVATSFALSVVRPYSCGIGGGGFMVIHLAPPEPDPETGERPQKVRNLTILYREHAPAAMGPDYFSALPDPDASTRGGHAVAVPGTVFGLLTALESFGTLDRATVLAPAIRLAEEGFAVDEHYVSSTRELIAWYRADPKRQEKFDFVWSRFLREGRVQVGDVIAVPEQAAALRLIAAEGRAAFYEGAIARAIVDAVKQTGGPMTLEDLAAYHDDPRPPVMIEFAGSTILTVRPPSSGGIAAGQTLLTLSRRRQDFDAAVAAGRESPAYIHLLTESFKHAFADRARFLGDPAMVDVPILQLLDKPTIYAFASAIDLTRTLAPEQYGSRVLAPVYPPPKNAGTSHASIVDRWGNAVAVTETINLAFGSLVAVEEFGFVLNNQIDDFTTRPGEANAFGLVQSARNAPQGGKRPLSSMTPMIVLDGPPDVGRVRVIAGASGGPRIITATVQSVLNVLAFDMTAAEAVGAPRLHHQWSPDRLMLEEGLMSAAAALEAKGHAVSPARGESAVQLIRRAKNGAGWDAASDPRKGGAPAGY